MPDKLSRFWQELKRRNVTRVLAVYIAAAFMLLELLDMVSGPFQLPQWSMKAGFFILLSGLVIAFIVSWLYDIHPEQGMVRTEPADTLKEQDLPKSSNGWKIASYVSFVVILGLIILNVLPGSEKKKNREKSIAVMPFINDSPSSENEYVIKGYRVSVHDMLCHVKDLKVLSLNSAEQYQNNSMTMSDLARELKVGYLLTASGQIYGNKIRLIVQLLDADENVIWSNPYDRQVTEVKDHIDIQSEIAKLVAGEIQAVTTPEERQLMDKIPTMNAIAYEFYQKGMIEYGKYDLFVSNFEFLRSAETYFKNALEYDPNLALAYAGWARVYFDLHWRDESQFSEDFLDTVLILSDKCIALDPQISDAYTSKGNYFRLRNQVDLALEAYSRSIEINPNDWSAYLGIGLLYYNDDLVKTTENITKALTRNHGPSSNILHYILGYTFYAAGFLEHGDSEFQKQLQVSGDSNVVIQSLILKEYMNGNYEKVIPLIFNEAKKDSLNSRALYDLGYFYSQTRQPEESAEYYERWLYNIDPANIINLNETHRIGYAFWMNGNKEQGDYYLDRQIDYCMNAIKLGRQYATSHLAYYDLAGTYAFRGERNNAYVNLRIFNQRERMPLWLVSMIRRDPLFDSIRDEPEFQQIVRDVEAKYQAEHERVRQWLEENDML